MEKVETKSFAEAAKATAEFNEIANQMNTSPLFLPGFGTYEKARQEGQLAFFKVMGVKCRPLNPAKSIRHRGKVFIHSKTTTKGEALEFGKRYYEALKGAPGINVLIKGSVLGRGEVR